MFISSHGRTDLIIFHYCNTFAILLVLILNIILSFTPTKNALLSQEKLHILNHAAYTLKELQRANLIIRLTSPIKKAFSNLKIL